MAFINKIILSATCCLGFLISLRAQTVTWQYRPVWSEVDVLNEELLRVRNQGKFGLVRIDGSQVVSCSYDLITEISEGYCLFLNVEQGGYRLKGILEVSTGDIVSLKDDYKVDADWPYFSEGLLPVLNSRQKWGYLNTRGELTIPCKYNAAFPFVYGLAAVQFSDGYFGHIDTRQITSLGRGQLGANQFRFASTFVMMNGAPVALIALRNSLTARNLSGDEVPLPKLELGTRPLFSHTMKEKDYSIDFNGAWQPTKITTRVQTIYGEGNSKPSSITPSVSSVTSALGSGGYDLRWNGRAFLAGQFEAVMPLSEEYVLAKQSGSWGILRLFPYDNLTVEPLPSSVKYSHNGATPFHIRANMPASLSGKALSIRCTAGNHIMEALWENGNDYILSVPTDQNTVMIETAVDNIQYVPQPITIQFSFKRGFSISIPSTAKVNASSMASLNITVSNTASSACETADVLIDGILRKTIGPLGPQERETVPVSLKVNLEDEDYVSRTVMVEIKEEGCPSVKNSQSVTFTRY